MKIRKKEFMSLKQGSMSVSEYRDKFIQLSRYAPDEVADERKQEHFIKGLNGPLQYALVAHTFPSFQRLLDKALAIEHKRVQLGDLKRKAMSQGQGSSSIHPRYSHPRVHQFAPAEASAQFSNHLRGLHRLVKLPQLAPRRSFHDRVQALLVSSVGRLDIMQMFAHRGLLLPQFRISSRLQDLARDSLLPGLIKSALMLPLTELTLHLVCFTLMLFLQPYYLILVLHIHLCLLNMPTQMRYHY
jgi:hypothetical protein